MPTKFIAVAALLTAAFLASAQSFWDGGAAMERGDASFESGYFAASNSFPAGTQVVVENLETGKTITVLVSGRISGQSDLLILLSPKAAASLGIIAGDVSPVRVTMKSTVPAPGGSSTQDYALSRDQDVNPAAGAPQATPDKPQTVAQTPKTTPPAETQKTTETTPPAQTGVVESLPRGKTPGAVAAVAPKTVEPSVPEEKKPAVAETPKTTPPEEKPTQAAPPETKPAPTPEELAKELASRNPQKQLYQPPREDQKFAYQPPAKPPEYTAAVPKETPKETTPEAPATPEIASIKAINSPPAAATEAPALAEADLPPGLNPKAEDITSPAAPGGQALAAVTPPAPEAPAPGTAEEMAAMPPELSVPAPAAPKPGETVIALEPAAPKPPEAAVKAPEKPPVAVAEKPQAVAPEVAPPKESPKPETTASVALVPTTSTERPKTPTQTVPSIRQTNYFLQLGAYTDEKQAKDLAAKVPASYPVSVVAPAENGAKYYRILLGPLNKAESGTLLYWFRDRGFPDAFVKAGGF